MEVAACVRDAHGHAASLLTRLNIQRQQAQFCDCVVRQKQSPAQLYPAHRCVLAASSPVLGSVLSSTGALVELQAPCLSGSVLALLLDYVYTGALPCTGTQEQYYSLLAAARYLQMDRLQEDLCDWEQTEASASDKANNSTENESRSREKISYIKTDTCGGEICGAGSLEKNVSEAAAEAQMPSSCRGLRVKEAEADATGAKQRSSGKDARAGSLSERSRNTHNDRPASHLTLQNHTLNISSTTEGYSASRVHKDMQEDQFHPAGTIKPGTWQNNTDEEMEGTDEGTRSSSSPPASPSSPPQPCCGAVPVICHSSRASMLPVSTAAAYRAVSQAPVDSSRPTGHERAAQHKLHYELEDLGYRSSTDQASTEDNQHPSQTLCYECVKDQSDTSSHAGHFVEVDEERDRLLSNHHQADWSDRRHVSVSAATETSSDDVPLPVDSDMGTDSYRWDSCLKGEAKEEQVFPGQCSPASHRGLYEPDTARHARLQRAAASTKEFPSKQREYDSHHQDTATLDRRHTARVRLPPPSSTQSSLETGGYFDCSTSLDLDKMSDTETSEPLFGLTLTGDSDISDPTCAMGQSYRGHVHYHCIPQDDRPHHHPSNPSSEEEETCLSPGRQNFTAGTSEPFLLLDISTKHAELLVSYKDRAEQEQQGTEGDRDRTSGTEIKNNDKSNDGTSVASVVKARTNMETECFHSVRCKSKFRWAPVKEASKHEEDENQASTRRICSAPCVPAPAPASASACIPPASPASTSASISARLSAPAHHAFQCSLCERSFSQRGSLNRHVRSHLGVRPFPCPRCPMTFSRQYRVTEHMRVHQRCSLGSDFPHPPATSI